MTPSKRVRDEAALICAIAASNPDYSEAYGAVAADLGIECVNGHADLLAPSYMLAIEAWRACQYESHADADAHALLMSGWTPTTTKAGADV